MEALVSETLGIVPSPSVWTGRRVLLTGHTGFKGSWLARWLATLGAEVHGLALDPPTDPSLYEMADVGRIVRSDHRVDLRDLEAVTEAIRRIEPSVVLHLAAQPLVRDGLRDPAGTFATNVQGTVNLLAALRCSTAVEATVIVTTDKVYSPLLQPHDEEDALGGHDPYAWSKVMVEQVVEAFRSLPALDGSAAWQVPVATARAGNVIGGGDWSHERLVPDCIRSFVANEPVRLRFPEAVRPWQHVLEPLRGYLLLAEALLTDRGSEFARPFNFGPQEEDEATVRTVASRLAEHWGHGAVVDPATEVGHPLENPMLRLRSERAHSTLGWFPTWDLATTLERTLVAYRDLLDGRGAIALDAQTDAYVADTLGAKHG